VVLLLFEYICRNNRPPLPANIQQLLDQQMPRPGKSGRYLMPAIQALSINIISLVLTELILLRNRKEKIETENARLRLANLEARHNQLKQQLHPHFLFNSLNTLKALIRKTPEQAEDYLVRLADLLRFSIYANKEESNREKEIICVNYLNMQQVRFGAALDYRIKSDNILHTGLLPVYSVSYWLKTR
jgi:sensor histidine kinase YesM